MNDILIVESDLSQAYRFQLYLESTQLRVTLAQSAEEAETQLDALDPAYILISAALFNSGGRQLVARIQCRHSSSKIIVLHIDYSIDVEWEARKLGIRYFIRPPLTRSKMLQMLRDLPADTGFWGFIGSSSQMRNVYRTVKAAANSKASVFITGESGTGKEVCANAIHRQGQRGQNKCVALNCAAIPKELMESEIFGHVKGAFTGALNHRNGSAKLAHQGTLFLDEICEMDLDLQGKLLRFIQTGIFQKVGSDNIETVDVRFICATNKDPLECIKQGTFREDLYYRLNVIPIHLPPLRQRGHDIQLIAKELLGKISVEEDKHFKHFSEDALRLLLDYHWPGNIRQLQNVIRNIVVLNDSQTVQTHMFPRPLNKGPSQQSHYIELETQHDNLRTEPAPALESSDIVELWKIEKQVIEEAIRRSNNNITIAAKKLGVSASTIYRKRQAWKTQGQL